ncbi:N-alpha-acetyltransferase 30 isoform X2 [Molossus molossus]|uniref:N-alpha-acetyltransferase 30, NatC catalytic subunit n=1 Tax=Molossus molossus TaxID=27622 RepID=A0A7J8JXE1_MOLMO|nr:N-alpha-acetyltransferase 30 isoform X2 [Molossus molossus]KAF6501517.1 N-alpha-acetyltransferase 30, NatC catalytic subunit [Molossus molossus]
MAEVPPGPSSLLPPPAPPASAVAEPRCPFPAGAALACCSEDEEDDEEHEGGGGRSPAGGEATAAAKGHPCLRCPQPPQEQQQQLNGLISPELRHLRAAASLKSKVLSAAEAATTTATPDGGPRATATKGAGVHSGESPPHCLPSNARTARPSPAEAAAASDPTAARNGLAEGTEQEEEENEQAMVGEECVGAIVCKLDMHKKMFRRGYIAMLAVDSKYRRNGIGTNLVKKAIYAMVEGDCDEVVLETEITNKSALKLYENLGFVRDKRLFRYYLNGVDALRLKLWLR